MTTLPAHARSKTQPPRHEYGFEDYLPGHLGGPLAPLNENNWHLGYAGALAVAAIILFNPAGLALRIARRVEDSFLPRPRIATEASGRLRTPPARQRAPLRV